MSDDISKQSVEEGSIVEEPSTQIANEFAGWVVRQTETASKKNRVCRLCHAAWTAGDWNFYDLCPKCFEEFDRQKMQGRMPTIGTKPRLGVDYYESSDAWIEEKRRKEGSTS